MRRLMSVAAAVCLTAGLVVSGGGAANAAGGGQTAVGDPCSPIDYTGDNGTTFVFPVSGCFDGDYSYEGGDPTVVYSEGGGTDGQPLIWYQSVGRAGATCPDGWTASYAEWPNGGKGGPTCDKSILWGMGPGNRTGATLSITINTVDDFINLDAAGDNYVTGCDVDADFYFPPFGQHLFFGCEV